jgi:hypothetical protein
MTDCCVDTAWIEARIAATKAMIEAYETAILAISTGSQSYRLSTGQTDQSVTKADLGSMRLALAALEDRLQHYQDQLCGTGSFYARPGF